MLDKVKKYLLFILLSIIAIYFITYKTSKKEPFYCDGCFRNSWVSFYDCMQCSNCGWCVDNYGNGSCTDGGHGGPNSKDCRSWYYGNMCISGPDCKTQSQPGTVPSHLISSGVHSFPVFVSSGQKPRRRPRRRR